MPTSGFDSPPTPSKDISKAIEPTNDLSILVDGTITVPNIELSKCNN
jgi:hypothetical protein